MKRHIKLAVTTALTGAIILSAGNAVFATDLTTDFNKNNTTITDTADVNENTVTEQRSTPATPATPATPPAPAVPKAATPATPATPAPATPAPKAVAPATTASPAPKTSPAPKAGDPNAAATSAEEVKDIVFYSDDISGLRERSKVFVEKKIITQETATKMNDYLTKLEQSKTNEVANMSKMEGTKLRGYIDQRRQLTTENEDKDILKNMVTENILTQDEAEAIKADLLDSTKSGITTKYKTEIDQLVAGNVISQEKADSMLNYVLTNHPAVKGFEEAENMGEVHFQQKADGGALYYEQKPTGESVYFEQTPGEGAVYYEQNALEGSASKGLDKDEIFSGMVEAGILSDDEVREIQGQISK